VRRATPFLAFGALLLASAGCTGPAKSADGRTYPEQLERRPIADIHVLRDVNRITLTNTTGESFESPTLWINAWYKLDLEGFDPGETLTLDLGDFRDQYGDRFSGGGFFSARRPDRLVLAELETGPADDRVLRGLVVIDGTAR